MSPKRVTKALDIYVRVSDTRGRTGESFISPREQEERCRALAQARGYKVGEVFKDLDESGGKMRRPELEKAITRIREGTSGGILVAKLDRFARTLVGGLQTMEEINDLGGVVVIADGEFDTATATGELVLNMMLSLAQFELRRIRENWQSAKRHAVDRGIHVSRHVPPGYSRDPETRLLRAHPVHGKTITEAYKMAAAGDSPARIARFLTEKKLPSGGVESVWHANRIRRLLANRVYLGEARAGNGLINAGAHTALTDSVTFSLAQREHEGRPQLTHSATSLLAGLCRCASCSFAMRAQGPRAGVVGAYRCRTETAHGRCPSPSSISAVRLEKYVIEQFLSHARGFVQSTPTEIDESLIAAAADAERSYRAVLSDTNMLKQIGAADHSLLVQKLHAEWQDAVDGLDKASRNGGPSPLPDVVTLAKLVEELQARSDTRGLRELLASGIQAVFVRPAKSRARNLPIGDRVLIVWRHDDPIETPKRGQRAEPRAFTW